MPTSPSTDQNTSKVHLGLLSYGNISVIDAESNYAFGCNGWKRTAELFHAVFPFLAVMFSDKLGSNLSFRTLRLVLDIQNHLDNFTCNIYICVTAVITAVIRLGNLWLNGRLAAAIGSDLSCEAYMRTLYQPYTSHLERNSSMVISSTTAQIARTVLSLNSLLQFFTAVLVAVGLLSGLLLINSFSAILAVSLFGSVYAILALTARRQLQNNSKKIALSTSQQLKALQEGLGAIRDVLLDGTQNSYLQIYRKADLPLRRYQAQNNFLISFPRYALEALGMLVISVVGGLLVLRHGEDASVIPLLGTLALGSQRLLPALQQSYSGWTTLKANHSAIEDVIAMLNQPLPEVSATILSTHDIFNDSICFCNVQFRYGSDQPLVLKSLNVCFNPGERIGLIGETGSGKSTTVDLLMGLLKPSSGQILVDGLDLHDSDYPERLNAWRLSIAHVPQSIFLADSSIAENIAFGIPKDQIDMDRVRYVAEQAQIASFIESNPESYSAFVGERGVRLSGGQRQRLGIARALYKRAKILVLDEATSALDIKTENAVMDSISGLSNELTIFMIATVYTIGVMYYQIRQRYYYFE